MNTTKIIRFVSIMTVCALSPLSVYALSTTINTTTGVIGGGVGTSASTDVTTSVKADVRVDARLSKIMKQSDSDITARINDLNKLSTRIQAMANVSETEKSVISTSVQSNIDGLNSLKAKIDADTDVSTATTDEKSIFSSYRIYSLVVPQSYIIASADRIITVTGIMINLGKKIQVRIGAAQAAGADVTTLNKTLVDFGAKIADAQTQASTANSTVVSLTPDSGDKSKMQTNTSALKSARANIKTASGDLQTARADIKTLIQGLKVLDAKMKVKVSAGASATTTTSSH